MKYKYLNASREIARQLVVSKIETDNELCALSEYSGRSNIKTEVQQLV